jgi:hypothetical protein
MALETYVGNEGKNTVRDDFPVRTWVKIGDNQRMNNIVIESAKLKRDTEYGEAIFLFCHDADTGELFATTFGMLIGQSGKRGTVYSRSAVETLLDCEFEGDDSRDVNAIANPTIKPAFVNRKLWFGKTTVAGKSWKAFECNFIEGEPEYDSDYRGISEEDEVVTDDKTDVDMTDPVVVMIIASLEAGDNQVTVSKKVEETFPNYTRNAAVKKVIEVKGSL